MSGTETYIENADIVKAENDGSSCQQSYDVVIGHDPQGKRTVSIAMQALFSCPSRRDAVLLLEAIHSYAYDFRIETS